MTPSTNENPNMVQEDSLELKDVNINLPLKREINAKV
jgi:hypothetical protein